MYLQKKKNSRTTEGLFLNTPTPIFSTPFRFELLNIHIILLLFIILLISIFYNC